MATQNINFPPIPDKVYGVDEPFILNATSDQGSTINYKVVSGNAELAGRFQLNILGSGLVTVAATAEAENGFDEASVEQTFDVSSGDYYQRIEAISRLKKKLDFDIKSLSDIPKISLSNVSNLSFDLNEQGVVLTINGKKYDMANKRFVEKFLKGSMDFLSAELVSSLALLEKRKTELKNL